MKQVASVAYETLPLAAESRLQYTSHIRNILQHMDSKILHKQAN